MGQPRRLPDKYVGSDNAQCRKGISIWHCQGIHNFDFCEKGWGHKEGHTLEMAYVAIMNRQGTSIVLKPTQVETCILILSGEPIDDRLRRGGLLLWIINRNWLMPCRIIIVGRMDLVTFDGRAISLYDIQYGMEWYLYTGYLQCTHVNRTIQWCAIISYLKRRYSILWR